MNADRTLPWDWYPGTIPENVAVDRTAYIETTFSFLLFRSGKPAGVKIDRGVSSYLGTMFDVGPQGQVGIGEYALLHGVWIICDAAVEIGSYALISWNVVIMDSYRMPFDPILRRRALERAAPGIRPLADVQVEARPIAIGRNVWIGFGACILPGVSIGEGSVVGACSVVADNVPPYTVVAGNPARVVRTLEKEVA